MFEDGQHRNVDKDYPPKISIVVPSNIVEVEEMKRLGEPSTPEIEMLVTIIVTRGLLD